MEGPIAGSRDAGELKNSAAVLENSMTNMFIKDKTYDNFYILVTKFAEFLPIFKSILQRMKVDS